MLTFDPEKHQYFWDGKPIPGVSEILRATGQAKDWKDVPVYYRERGQAAHQAIALFLKGTLDETSVDEVIQPYLNQFKEWINKERGAGLLFSENPFYSEKLVFAGTVDLICNECIYDIKCSKKLDADAEWQYSMQGAAYRTLVRENLEKDFPFRVLLLTGAGEAKVIPLYAPTQGWEAVMSLYNVKMARDV